VEICNLDTIYFKMVSGLVGSDRGLQAWKQLSGYHLFWALWDNGLKGMATWSAVSG